MLTRRVLRVALRLIRRRQFVVWGLFTAGAAAGLMVFALAAEGAAFAAQASVTPTYQYMNDTVGTVYTFTVHNTGTSTSIGAVEIDRPAIGWTITACPLAPAGWSIQTANTKCRYRSANTTADDIAPGATAQFQVKATTTGGFTDRTGTWPVIVSKSNSFDTPSLLSHATATGSGLTTTVYTWEITDAVVASSARTPGSACPAPNKSAVTASTGHVIVLCGRNHSFAALTPLASFASLGGSFIGSHGAFTSGSIPALSGNVVIGNWSNVTITSVYGPGKTVVAKVGSATHQTSPLTTLTGYEATDRPPVATGDAYSTNEDTPLSVPAPGVLANDSDPDGNPITAVLDTSPANGSVTLNSDGSFTYTPNANFNGTDSFTYSANDGIINGNAATVTITVNAVNDPPVVHVPGPQTDNEDNALVFSTGGSNSISATDVDAGSGAVTADLTVSHGTLLVSQTTGLSPSSLPAAAHLNFSGKLSDVNAALNGLTYQPDSNYNGSDSLSFTINDNGNTGAGGPLTDTGTVALTINPVNDPPSFSLPASPDQSVLEDAGPQLVSGFASNISAGPPDESGQTLTFHVSNDNTGLFSGQPSIDPSTGDLTFTTAPNANGSATVSVYLTDDGGTANGGVDTSPTQTFQINVTPVNDPPSFTLPASPDQTVLQDSGSQLVSGFASNISAGPPDESGQVLTFHVSNDNTGLFSGQPSIDPTSGDLAYTPAAGQTGSALVTVTLQDDGGTANGGVDTSAPQTFTITVKSPNQPPTDVQLSPTSVDENQPVGTTVGTLTSTDPDVGETFTYSLVAGAGDTDNADFMISGDQLQTAAIFDFETKSSYSIRVQTADSGPGNLTFSKSFTITINDINDAPTDIGLSNNSIDENQPAGTTVGTLSSTDQDAGETFTYSLQSTGCGGGPYPDNASFAISGSTLQSAASFDFETKSLYTICVRTTDSGSPPLSFDKELSISINDVNDPPVANPDSYSGAIGNTVAVVQTTTTGPHVVLSGNSLIANDTDQDNPSGAFAHALSAVPETVTSTDGGTAQINSDGSFVFTPAVGDENTNDTFTYHVTDGSLTSAGTATIHIDNFRVWYVDSSSAAPTHDGRSNAPFLNLSSLNGAGGSGDSDGPGDYIFVYRGNSGTTPYAGGIPLEANESLWGESHGLSVDGDALVAAGANPAVITNAGGVGVGLANGSDVEGITVSGASGNGIAGSAVTTSTVGGTTAVSVTGSGGDGVSLTGAASGNISVAASISGNTGHSVVVSSRTGGTVAFSGSVSDSGLGISLANNTGATVNFTGGVTASSGSHPAFTATGGGTVNVTGSSNTLTTTTGTALDVENTTIGASGLTFKSISANGAANGILLSNTGTSGSLSVTGAGGVAASGGTIQNTTGAGISLTSTSGPSFNNVTIQNTANAPGVDGTGVHGFSYTNGAVSGSGSTSHGAFDSNIAFNDNGTTVDNVDGAVTITGNTLSNAFQSGVDILNNSGTISDLNISNNTITSPTAPSSSAGSGIRVNELGSASGAASVTKGELNGNTITNFPNGAGVVVQGGNVTSSSAPAGNFGISNSSAVQIDNNKISGQSLANPMGTNCILVTMPGRGTGFVDVSNNGTLAQPLAFNKGNCLSVNSTGSYQLTATVDGNFVKPQSQLSGSFGISGGTDKQVLADTSTADSAVLNLTANGNNVSSTTGVGIYFLANSSGTLNAKIQNNTVAAPTDTTVARPAIRVDSGSSAGTAVNTTVCAQISGNTATGSNVGGFQFDGIALRKQGTTITPDAFGLVGLSPSPATDSQMQSYLEGQNPAETLGSGGGGALINTHGSSAVWQSCTLGF